MKWFIKVLTHYADFSGRARRKEYWMFVLFNAIFSFAWLLIWTILFAFKGDADEDTFAVISLLLITTYSVIMMLPGFAVVVRRLHDSGKSGWMLLVGLIPLIGGLWLFILMLLDSQEGENNYGENPKTANPMGNVNTSGEQWKLKSAGLTLLIAAAAILLSMIIDDVYLHFYYQFPITIGSVMALLAYLLLLISGVTLRKAEYRNNKDRNIKSAFMQILIATSALTIISVVSLIEMLKNPDLAGSIKVHAVENIIFFLTMAACCAVTLFAPLYKRTVILITIAVSGLYLLLSIYNGIQNAFLFPIREENELPGMILRQYRILLPIAFVLIAATFLPEQKQEVMDDRE